jgi:hypothetical protein
MIDVTLLYFLNFLLSYILEFYKQFKILYLYLSNFLSKFYLFKLDFIQLSIMIVYKLFNK